MIQGERKLTYREVRESFLERDNDAVSEFQNSVYSATIEGRISFISARLEDTMQVLLYVLRRLVEEEETQVVE